MDPLLVNGIYPPLPTFFDANDELDIPTLHRHMHRLLVGCGDASTRSTIANCRAAAHHAADIALVLPPFYYRGSMNAQALITHYRAVADASPIPILIYNMPANTGGLDLDASTICTLATHANIIGVKDSAGNVAKLAQIIAAVPETFKVFAGSASYLLPALSVGAAGAVSALANVFPQEVCDVQALFDAGQLDEARTLQARIIPANNAVTTVYSVPGLKAALDLTAGYGGVPRMPLLPLTAQERVKLSEMLSLIRDES
ncbi:MAG: hypothetical protein NVS9B9_16630 [Ktedonobacteraceae bacterium]